MKTKSISNYYWIYILSSISFGLFVTWLSLSSTHWTHFLNSRPKRGEMGLGRFLIRGSRYIQGKYTPFAYAWRSIEPDTTGQIIGGLGYGIHQVGQWLILFQVQMSKRPEGWSDQYRVWNWRMVYLNGFMLLFKLIHGWFFYDGLAWVVPEGIAQGSVVLILVLAIVIAIPSRGFVFGLGKKSFSDTVIGFIRKYHGYAMSFGTVLNFHYHPIEGTMGHTFGFIYQCLLIWQSTNFLHRSHRNTSWTILLESWVFIHGTLTAIIQPGTSWQIFSYGFLVMFLTNQLFQLKPKFWIVSTLYSLFGIYIYWGFKENKAYYRTSFIPVAEFGCALFILMLGKFIQVLLPNSKLRIPILGTIYLISNLLLTIGLAFMLAGGIKVYNDY